MTVDAIPLVTSHSPVRRPGRLANALVGKASAELSKSPLSGS